MVKNIVPAVCLAMLFAQPVFADDDGNEDGAIEYRQAIMTLLQDNYKPMKAMAESNQPMNRRLLSGMARDLAVIASVNLVRGFPQGSMGEDSDAKAEIWQNKRDFASKLNDLREATKELKKAVSGGNESAIRLQLDAVGRSCKACHREYKEK